MSGSSEVPASMGRAFSYERLVQVVALAAVFTAAFFLAYEVFETRALTGRVSMGTIHLLHLFRGLTASFLLAGFVAWYLIRQQAHAGSVLSGEATKSLIDHTQRLRSYIRWLVEMRWVAAWFILALVIISVPVTRLLPMATLPLLLGWWAILATANLYFGRTVDSARDLERHASTQIVVDIIVLTGLLNASGGIENPLSVAYVFHIIIAAIVLPQKRVLQITAFASGLFILLALGELFHVLPHFTNLLFPHHPEMEMDGSPLPMMHASYDPVFVVGRTLPWVGVFFATGYFMTLVVERLRKSELELEHLARNALLERQRVEGLIDTARIGTLVAEPDLSILWSNDRVRAWLRFGDGHVSHDHGTSASACPACLVLETFSVGHEREIERSCVDESGSTKYFRHATFPLRSPDGKTVQVVQIVEDITARKDLEAQALHAGKLAVLGQMAAGIAHEIGNPLSSLDARLRLMKHRSSDRSFIEQSLEVLREQLERIGRIVRGVSHFSRGHGDDWIRFDINAVADEALHLIALDRRAARAAFETKFTEGPLLVRGVRDQLLQVIVNLLINAVEAVPDGGTVRVESARLGSFVRIAVTDDGIGIDDSIRQRLFQPFVTTKKEGTGIGLSICYSLIHAHGGSIDVESIRSGGTRVIVLVPAGEAESAPEIAGTGVAHER